MVEAIPFDPARVKNRDGVRSIVLGSYTTGDSSPQRICVSLFDAGTASARFHVMGWIAGTSFPVFFTSAKRVLGDWDRYCVLQHLAGPLREALAWMKAN